MRRTLAAAVVALLAATAGCNAVLGGDPSPAPTPTATDVSTTAAPAGTPERVGVSADGVTDPLRLAGAHVEALEPVSYTVRHRRVLRADNGTTLGTFRMVGRVSRGWGRFSVRERRSGVYAGDRRVSTLLAFANETRGFLLWRFRGERSYQRLYRSQVPVGPGDLTAKTLVYLAFAGVETTVSGVERANGSVVYVLTATAGPHAYGGSAVRNVTLSARVERSGRVRRLRLSYDRVGGGDRGPGPGHVVEVLRFGRFNRTTVAEPPWVERVRANTSGLSGDRGGAGEADR